MLVQIVAQLIDVLVQLVEQAFLVEHAVQERVLVDAVLIAEQRVLHEEFRKVPAVVQSTSRLRRRHDDVVELAQLLEREHVQLVQVVASEAREGDAVQILKDLHIAEARQVGQFVVLCAQQPNEVHGLRVLQFEIRHAAEAVDLLQVRRVQSQPAERFEIDLE